MPGVRFDHGPAAPDISNSEYSGEHEYTHVQLQLTLTLGFNDLKKLGQLQLIHETAARKKIQNKNSALWSTGVRAMSVCVKRVSVRLGAQPSHVMPQSVRPGYSTANNEMRRTSGIVGAASRHQQAAQVCRRAFWRSLRSSSAVVARSSDDKVGSSVAMKTSPDANGEREGGHDVRMATSGELAGTSAASPEPGSGAERQGDRPKPVIAHRWKVVAMMAVAFILCNMDKVNMSVAVIPMAKELGWSATDRGLVSSAFFWGYTLTQVPGGYISTKLGGAKVLMGGVFLWSLGTIIAPPCAHAGLLALCASRMLVGLGEGFAPSAVTSVMARLVPPTERARAVTTVFGGLDVGSAVGLLICGPLIKMYGWPSVFYLFGLLGIVWCALFPTVKPNRTPDEATDRAAQASAPSSASNGATPAKAQEKMPWGKFMTSSAVWAIITAHFCFNYGYYTLLAWLPSYFELALGLNVEKSSLLTLIPYIAMTCMTPFVGPTADGLVKSGSSFWNTTRVRKLCQGISFLFPALCMIVCAALTPAAGTLVTGPAIFLLVGVMSLAFAFSAWARGGLYCNHQDLSPKYASALLGITNTAGALPGVLGVTSAGFLLDATGSWALAVFLPTAACQLFGLVVYLLLASGERQGWD